MGRVGTVVVLGLIVVGCGDDPAGLDDVSFEEGVAMCTPTGASGPWRFERVGAGSKPALAVGTDGAVHVAYMHESTEGWVRHARLSASGSETAESAIVAEGYFYGPIDIVLDAGGAPSVLYHDHTREDQVLAESNPDGSFALRPMSNQGHDGWYNAGAFDAAGMLHTATYDPAAFSGRGVIYGRWDGASWSVEVASAGNFDYAGGMAIVPASGGELYVTYFDDIARLGRVSTRTAGGTWSTVEIEGPAGRTEIGRFPDAALDPDGSTLHLVYLARGGAAGDVIRYATGVPGSFVAQDVASLSDFTIGFAGARDIATLDVDGSGTPYIASQTRSEMRLFSVNDQGPQEMGTFGAASGISFMQQTEVVVDARGRVHLVWWQSGGVPGTVCYGTNG